MTKEEHRKRHHELHMALDELVADWMNAEKEKREKRHPILWTRCPSRRIRDLMQWAGLQTIKVDHEPEGVHEEG